jgi:soluble lytic murein transglycosylase-like protein
VTGGRWAVRRFIYAGYCVLLVAASLALPPEESWERGLKPVHPPLSLQLHSALTERADIVLSAEAGHLPEALRQSIRDAVVAAAIGYDLDVLLLLALIKSESAFDPDVVSPRGAVGLLQILPTTARWITDRLGTRWSPEVPLADPWTNVRLGASYLSYLLDRFGDLRQAILAYNLGPSGLADGWGLDPSDEAFTRRVLDEYRRYSALSSCKARPCPSELVWAAWWNEGAGVVAACREAANAS